MYPGTNMILSLKRSAMIVIGQQVWQGIKVDNLIQALFYSDAKRSEESKRNLWDIFCHAILTHLKEFQMPSTILKCELLHVVRGMGDELYDWHGYIEILSRCYFGRYRCELDYPEIQFWTRFGTLDTRKIIEENWMNNADSYNVSAVYNIACRRGINREKVKALWKIDGLYPLMGDATSLYYSDYLPEKLAVGIFGDFYLTAMKSSLFLESVENAGSELVQTLWKEFDHSEKNIMICKSFQKALEKYRECTKAFEKRKYAEIILFLFGELSDEQKIEITEKSAVGILEILSNYPWQCLFHPISMEMKKLKIIKDELLDKITQEYYADFKNIRM